MNIYSDVHPLKGGLVLLIISVLTGLLLSACDGKQQEFETSYELVLRETAGKDLLTKLIDLEATYPGQVKLKTKIASILLATGKTEKARPYIREAKELQHKADSETKGRLYLNLGLLAFNDKDYRQALAYAESALKFSPALEETAFMKAGCYFQTDKREEAYTLYTESWASGRSKMTRDDLLRYSELLLEKGDYKRELEVLEQYQRSIEYSDGLGFLSARIYGMTGEMEKAVVASAMDLEYGYGTGVETVESIINRLTALEQALKKDQIDTEGKATGLIAALKAFFLGNYPQALGSLKAQTMDLPFFKYLLLVSRLAVSGPETETMEDYLDLEPFFRSFPTYYYHLWQNKKKTADYTLDTVGEIMAKGILAAPQSPLARKTRLELGRLSGMKETDSPFLLLSEELDILFEKATGEQAPESLSPVLDLLATEDNGYVAPAVSGLEKLAGEMPLVRTYLEEKEAEASGLLKERLRLVLKKTS